MNAMILEETSRGFDSYSVESSLFRKRILFLNEEITSDSSNRLIEYLLHLDMVDPGKEITMCINSPGGDVISGLAVYDIMKSIKSSIRTICTGTAASMGSILFLAGRKREMLPHTRILIHDPSISGFSGNKKALDFERETSQLMETRRVLAEIIAKTSGHTIEEIFEKTRDDCIMNAEEAIRFGIATGICKHIL